KRQKGKPKLFTSADFYFDKSTLTCRCPAGKKMWLSVKQIETDHRQYIRFAGHLKDCRACPLQLQCMRKAVGKQGRQVQFLINKGVKPVSYTDKMRVKIDSGAGRRQYSKRLGAIEPVFGNITVNKGMNKFTLRGQEKVNAQWQMYCLVHNIEKLRASLH
ncbi:transposase, partial [Psychromonas aquimarina]|uniref:transposase n=1 Tax=Psychromonas aquimarina TaxID=444919 RepID=UPI0004902081